jgi:hypothetical protein
MKPSPIKCSAISNLGSLLTCLIKLIKSLIGIDFVEIEIPVTAN